MNAARFLLFVLAAILALTVAVWARPVVAQTPGVSAGAPAGASGWERTEQSAVRLISASETVGDAGSVTLGLHVRLADGWKTYWRSPGDAGFPPRIDWSGSENLATTEISWPAPLRFSVLGLETVGYEGEVVLPIEARPVAVGDAMRLQAKVDYLTCSEICIPQTAELDLALPAGPPEPSAFAHLIARYDSQVPSRDASSAMEVVSAATLDSEGTGLVVRARSDVPFARPDVFVEGPEMLAFGAPAVDLGADPRQAALSVPVYGAESLDRPLVGRSVVVTLVDGERAVERTVVVEGDGDDAAAASTRSSVASSGPGQAASGPSSVAGALDPGQADVGRSFAAILALGFLGGLILNLMPCVLPVLSIKLLGVVGHGGGQRRTVRLSFLASAAGILASFLALAGVLVLLKMAGMTIGWGIQFQQPWFLVAMVLVVVLFAGNLWGLFEVRLPRLVADAGERVGHVRGLGGHFLTGALATVLATPCSAPFLGTAVGFALARGTGEILTVLTAVGLGLATPYLAVAAAPALATRLPRPGRWMTVLRRILGIALAATALWLLSVLAAQVGVAAAALAGVLAAAATGMVALGTRLSSTVQARGAFAAAALLATVSFLAHPSQGVAPEVPATASLEGLWTPFDEAAIADVVRDGRVVFVNVTADWCITCKVNEAFILSNEDVRDRLTGDGIVAMQGDWTRPSDAISRYLASFGRYGIPFDAVYGPGLPQGEALPELLTPEMVLSALERAAGEEQPPQQARAATR